MSNKTRRHSNWYIYLITFIITAGVLTAVVWQMRDLLFPVRDTGETRTGSADYRPGREYNKTTVLMLADMKGASPQYIMLANYRPRDDTCMLIPLPVGTVAEYQGKEMTLLAIYDEGGAEAVKQAITELTGVQCDYYAKFDRLSFVELGVMFGDISINLPYGIDTLNLTAGRQTLNAKQVYDYITYTGEDKSEDSLTAIASCTAKLLNGGTRDLSVTELQALFDKAINNVDTDFDFMDFQENQAAYAYTTANSPSFAVYYVPYGSEATTGFYLDENSLLDVKERCGITE
jgi:anionic cell wall polymer biosynthesis LytR-Cps2A-Psr (LCP) family protein